MTPVWGIIAGKGPALSEEGVMVLTSEQEILRLRLENQLLNEEVQRMRDVFLHELYLSTQVHETISKDASAKGLKPLIKPHKKDLLTTFSLQLQTLPARVIFRTTGSWNSSLWINVGKADNLHLGREVVARNSPVVVGTSVVGVVDYVGVHQSRVKLITDSGLSPSVRAMRMTSNGEVIYLAKGELHGSSKPMWRSKEMILQGIGFNYDFSDEEGPARDLRTGKPVQGNDERRMAIIKKGDLLLTTGMDGVFPKGFHVAEVTKVLQLEEGDYYYEIEAKPSAGNIHELDLVFVIPPLGYDAADQPPTLGGR